MDWWEGRWGRDGSLASAWLSHHGESRAGWADHRTRSGCDKGQISEKAPSHTCTARPHLQRLRPLPWREWTRPTQKGDLSTFNEGNRCCRCELKPEGLGELPEAVGGAAVGGEPVSSGRGGQGGTGRTSCSCSSGRGTRPRPARSQD